MTFGEFLLSESNKLILGAITTAVGFFIALIANSRVEEWKERRAYKTLLNAVCAEAQFNREILEQSFLPLYADGVVLREFSLEMANQNLSSPLFIKHASQQVMEVLGQYVRELTLANAYRGRAEMIRFNDSYLKKTEQGKLPRWEEPLVENWAENLDAVKISIAKVINIRTLS